MLKFTLWSTNALYKSTLTSFDSKSKKHNCYGGIKTTECTSRPGQQFLGCWSRSQLELHIMQEDRRIGSQDGDPRLQRPVAHVRVSQRDSKV